MRELFSSKAHCYYTKLQHSSKFKTWFLAKYKVDLSKLRESNDFDERLQMVQKKMTLKHMWAIYYNVVKDNEA